MCRQNYAVVETCTVVNFCHQLAVVVVVVVVFLSSCSKCADEFVLLARNWGIGGMLQSAAGGNFNVVVVYISFSLLQLTERLVAGNWRSEEALNSALRRRMMRTTIVQCDRAPVGCTLRLSFRGRYKMLWRSFILLFFFSFLALFVDILLSYIPVEVLYAYPGLENSNVSVLVLIGMSFRRLGCFESLGVKIMTC